MKSSEAHATQLKWILFMFNYKKVHLFRFSDPGKMLRPKVLRETESCQARHAVFSYLRWELRFWSYNAWITQDHNLGKRAFSNEIKFDLTLLQVDSKISFEPVKSKLFNHLTNQNLQKVQKVWKMTKKGGLKLFEHWSKFHQTKTFVILSKF